MRAEPNYPSIYGMLEAAKDLLTLPIPLIGLLVVGVLVWRRRALSRVLVGIATLGLVGFSLPITADQLERPLTEVAPQYRPGASPEPAAILVPTAGIFADSTGAWWASSTSIVRAVAGRELQRQTGLPLLLVGGSPLGESESEAAVVARAVGLVAGFEPTETPPVLLESAARNSAETAQAAKQILERLGGNHVVLVTSPTHTARMAASLRRLGIEVSVATARRPPSLSQPFGRFQRFVPSAGGLNRSAGAVREYIGIVWYLFRGRFDFSDLRGAA